MLAAKNFINQPRPQMQQTSTYNPFFASYYNPTLAEYNEYQDRLRWHTDNIPKYIVIRYGEKGIEWVFDKFGDEVKRCYYSNQ